MTRTVLNSDRQIAQILLKYLRHYHSIIRIHMYYTGTGNSILQIVQHPS